MFVNAALELNEMGNIQLKRSHKYYTQVISQIVWAKVQLSKLFCYLVVKRFNC